MAEINESEIDRIDCSSTSLTSTSSNKIQQLSQEMSDKVYSFIHGEMAG